MKSSVTDREHYEELKAIVAQANKAAAIYTDYKSILAKEIQHVQTT